jgi:predicted N-acetyltransferase YhbS
MDEIANQLIWAALEAIKAEGHQARIVFHTDQ